jgi:hypothetical protein
LLKPGIEPGSPASQSSGAFYSMSDK